MNNKNAPVVWYQAQPPKVAPVGVFVPAYYQRPKPAKTSTEKSEEKKQ